MIYFRKLLEKNAKNPTSKIRCLIDINWRSVKTLRF